MTPKFCQTCFGHKAKAEQHEVLRPKANQNYLTFLSYVIVNFVTPAAIGLTTWIDTWNLWVWKVLEQNFRVVLPRAWNMDWSMSRSGRAKKAKKTHHSMPTCEGVFRRRWHPQPMTQPLYHCSSLGVEDVRAATNSCGMVSNLETSSSPVTPPSCIFNNNNNSIIEIGAYHKLLERRRNDVHLSFGRWLPNDEMVWPMPPCEE